MGKAFPRSYYLVYGFDKAVKAFALNSFKITKSFVPFISTIEEVSRHRTVSLGEEVSSCLYDGNIFLQCVIANSKKLICVVILARNSFKGIGYRQGKCLRGHCINFNVLVSQQLLLGSIIKINAPWTIVNSLVNRCI